MRRGAVALVVAEIARTVQPGRVRKFAARLPARIDFALPQTFLKPVS
jgi:hypothetical protein